MVVFSSQIFLPLGKLLLYYFRKDVYLLYFAEEGVFLPSFLHYSRGTALQAWFPSLCL